MRVPFFIEMSFTFLAMHLPVLCFLLAGASVGLGSRIPSVVPKDTIGFRPDTKFVLVVGSVTRTGARVLWEVDHGRTKQGSVNVDVLEVIETSSSQEETLETIHSASFSVADRPQVREERPWTR